MCAPSSDIITHSATAMLHALRRKELSPVELIQAHIVRFAQIQPHINAVTHAAFADALRHAAAAEKAILQGQVDWSSQPLFGLPFSVKNHIDVQGVPTTAGAPAWKCKYATEDADVVRQLRRAGAILIVTTNMPCLALSYDSENLLFGRTNNPYDLTRSAGGSSGGEGALVAACGSPLGVGSDNNGSIRLPSAWNGIAGLRPAPGRISLRGMQPAVADDQRDAWAVGPMARYVDDLEMALPAFLRPDASAGIPPLRHSSQVDLRRLKITFLTKWNHGKGEPTADIQEAVAKSARFLEKGGAAVQEGLPEVFHHIGRVVVNEMLGPGKFSTAAFRETLEQMGAEADPLLMAAVQWIDQWQRVASADDQRAKLISLGDMQAAFSDLMEEVDALILPVHAEPAMRQGTAWPNDPEDHCEEKYAYCYFCRLMGQHPAGTVRVGATQSGLPIGVQVIGRRYREDIVLRILRELEAEFGGWTPPPPVRRP